jgi:hypothetical protein
LESAKSQARICRFPKRFPSRFDLKHLIRPQMVSGMVSGVGHVVGTLRRHTKIAVADDVVAFEHRTGFVAVNRIATRSDALQERVENLFLEVVGIELRNLHRTESDSNLVVHHEASQTFAVYENNSLN